MHHTTALVAGLLSLGLVGWLYIVNVVARPQSWLRSEQLTAVPLALLLGAISIAGSMTWRALSGLMAEGVDMAMLRSAAVDLASLGCIVGTVLIFVATVMGARRSERTSATVIHLSPQPSSPGTPAEPFRQAAQARHVAGIGDIIMEDFWQIAAVGFGAQLVDGALGMAYGLTSTSLLLTLGYTPAAASAAVHLAETATTAASAASHAAARNVDWRLVRPLAIAGVLGGIAGASVLATGVGGMLAPFVAAYLTVMGGVILWKAYRATPGIRPPKGLLPLGGIGGFLDAVGGGGWGPIVSGTLVASGNSARHMIGSAIAAEFFVTTAIAVTFAGHLGLNEFGWAALALVVGGLPAAPFAAFLVRVAPRRALMLGVGCLIVALGLHGLWRAFGQG